MTTNRTWLAFANETICNHRKALKELGFVSWTTNIKSKFAEGDIVYLFMNDDRSVRFKLRVTKVNVPREDGNYWNGDAPNDTTYRLELIGNEYGGNLLLEPILEKFGFKGGNSILPQVHDTRQLHPLRQVHFPEHIRSLLHVLQLPLYWNFHYLLSKDASSHNYFTKHVTKNRSGNAYFFFSRNRDE